jgi:pyrimidine-nucleoside phosphorylase
MRFVEAIIRKRDGGALDRSQIAQFVAGATDGSLPSEQLAAMLMAVCWRGMDPEETGWLTEEMLRSGEQWRLASDRPEAVDKHSTGGVGDTVSLILGPLLAAVRVPVAMMAGRGLGHSQGTLDKLAAVPGFRCTWSRDEVLALLDGCGVAFVAQSQRIAPADRVLYGLRDITGTVPSLPLIVASIMSKKLAMGAGTLLLDVKWGRGAFRGTVAEAVELADALRGVAQGMGVAAEALLTDMNQPLGPALGTAVEVRAARDVLAGGGGAALREVSLRLAEQALVLRGSDVPSARAELTHALDGGSALEAWNRLVVAHGGDPDPERLERPTSTTEVLCGRDGWVTGVASDVLGRVASQLGAGREKRTDELDHAGGLEVHVRIGDQVATGQPLATVLIGRRAVDLDGVVTKVRDAFEIGTEPVDPPTLVLGTVDEVAAAG